MCPLSDENLHPVGGVLLGLPLSHGTLPRLFLPNMMSNPWRVLVCSLIAVSAAVTPTVTYSTAGATISVENASALSVQLREYVDETDAGAIAAALDAHSSYRFHPMAYTLGAVDSLFAWGAPMNTTTEGYLTVPRCANTIPNTTQCLQANTVYSSVISAFNGSDVLLDAFTLTIGPVPKVNAAPASLSLTPGQYSIEAAWSHPTPIANASNTVQTYRIQIFLADEGNFQDLAGYAASPSALMPVELDLGATLDSNLVVYNITGCYNGSDALVHCIAPWTVYQVVVTAIGSEFTDSAFAIAATLTAPQPHAVNSTWFSYSPSTTQFTIRTSLPFPWTGQPTAYYYQWTGDYNQAGNQTTVISTVPGALVEALSFANTGVPIHVLRMFNLIPATTIIAYFAPVNSAGRALELSGPVIGRTRETAANTPLAPILSAGAEYSNFSSAFVVTWSAPVPPFGVIVRYQIAINFDQFNPVDSFIIVYDSINTTIFETELNATVALTLMNGDVRVRAFTSTGPSSWSDRAIDNRPIPVVPTTSPQTRTISGGAIAAIVVPITAVLILLVLLVLSKNRRVKEDIFEFPAPDEWEIAPTTLHIKDTIGSGAFGKVYSAMLIQAENGSRNGQEMLVAVKTLKGSTGNREKRNFVREAEAFKTVNSPGHENVLRLIGCVFQSFPLMIVTELADRGSLKDFLVSNRPERASNRAYIQVTLLLKLRFASDISTGMDYLSKKGWVHRGGSLICMHSIY